MQRLPRLTVQAAAGLLALSACHEAALPTDPQLALERGGSQRTECRNQVVTGSVRAVYVPPGFSCTVTGATVAGGVEGNQSVNLDVSESTVGGSIVVQRSAGALSVRHSIVTGNIEATSTASVLVSSTTLDRGSIVVKEGSGSVTIQGDRSGFTALSQGDIAIERRTGGSILLSSVSLDKGQLRVTGNSVTGTLDVTRNSFADLRVRENTVSGGARLAVDQNRVAGGAELFKNRGAGAKRAQLNVVGGTLTCRDNEQPFEGGPNTAGKTEGQCH
jgi:hypothetical protein